MTLTDLYGNPIIRHECPDPDGDAIYWNVRKRFWHLAVGMDNYIIPVKFCPFCGLKLEAV